MTQRSNDVSDAELDVLRVLWKRDSGTVREVQTWLRPKKRRWAYTTVQTLLNRLEAKGYVKSDKSAQAHVFSPAVPRQRFLAQRLKALADDICDGTAALLVLALVQSQQFSQEEIEEFRRLIDEQSREAK